MTMQTPSIDAVFDRRSFLAAASVLAATGFPSAVRAADYPAKPIRFIVPATAGGGTDAMGRLVANAIAEARKWTFVIENLPGGGANIGMDQVAKAAKDGYTIGIGESSNLVNSQYLYSSLPFAADRDLEPIALIGKVPLVLVVGANSKLDSVAAVMSAAKQKGLSFASSGNGTVGHLAGELWKRRMHVDIFHVPYKGAAQAMSDLAGGQVDIFFASITSALPLIKGGKVRPLAVTSPNRSALLKDVPSFSELGQKEMEASVLYGIVGPKGLPEPVVALLNAEINKAFNTPAVRNALIDQGADPATLGGTPKQFDTLLQQERVKWSKVVKESGAKVD